jgi:dTDP-4-dehydrorhamnose 3,5-epimerase-like enzyme
MVIKTSLRRVVNELGILTPVLDKSILEGLGLSFGQLYLVAFQGVGTIRGNHYHLRQTETVVLVRGAIRLLLRCVDTDREWSFELSSDDPEPAAITFGPRIAHAVVSLSESAILLSHSDLMYDPENPDRVPYVLTDNYKS